MVILLGSVFFHILFCIFIPCVYRFQVHVFYVVLSESETLTIDESLNVFQTALKEKENEMIL